MSTPPCSSSSPSILNLIKLLQVPPTIPQFPSCVLSSCSHCFWRESVVNLGPPERETEGEREVERERGGPGGSWLGVEGQLSAPLC